MHPRSIAAREAKARETIQAAAAALADRFGVPPLVDVTPIERRTPGVGPMRELECVAALLQAVASATAGEQTHGSTG